MLARPTTKFPISKGSILFVSPKSIGKVEYSFKIHQNNFHFQYRNKASFSLHFSNSLPFQNTLKSKNFLSFKQVNRFSTEQKKENEENKSEKITDEKSVESVVDEVKDENKATESKFKRIDIKQTNQKPIEIQNIKQKNADPDEVIIYVYSSFIPRLFIWSLLLQIFSCLVFFLLADENTREYVEPIFGKYIGRRVWNKEAIEENKDKVTSEGIVVTEEKVEPEEIIIPEESFVEKLAKNHYVLTIPVFLFSTMLVIMGRSLVRSVVTQCSVSKVDYGLTINTRRWYGKTLTYKIYPDQVEKTFNMYGFWGFVLKRETKAANPIFFFFDEKTLAKNNSIAHFLKKYVSGYKILKSDLPLVKGFH